LEQGEGHFRLVSLIVLDVKKLINLKINKKFLKLKKKKVEKILKFKIKYGMAISQPR